MFRSPAFLSEPRGSKDLKDFRVKSIGAKMVVLGIGLKFPDRPPCLKGVLLLDWSYRLAQRINSFCQGLALCKLRFGLKSRALKPQVLRGFFSRIETKRSPKAAANGSSRPCLSPIQHRSSM